MLLSECYYNTPCNDGITRNVHCKRCHKLITSTTLTEWTTKSLQPNSYLSLTEHVLFCPPSGDSIDLELVEKTVR